MASHHISLPRSSQPAGSIDVIDASEADSIERSPVMLSTRVLAFVVSSVAVESNTPERQTTKVTQKMPPKLASALVMIARRRRASRSRASKCTLRRIVFGQGWSWCKSAYSRVPDSQVPPTAVLDCDFDPIPSPSPTERPRAPHCVARKSSRELAPATLELTRCAQN